MLLLGFVCLIPQFVYEAFFPQPFNITAYSESVDYEFRDEDSAIEFANLNDDAEWIEIK